MSTPFNVRELTVKRVSKLGAYYSLTLDNSAGPEPKAGQFYMLQTADNWSLSDSQGQPFLSRALSHMSATNGDLEFLIDVVGPGTGRLVKTAVGESIKVLGPLGNGFSTNDDRLAVLVGGGIGVAPLLALQESLPQASVALLGFRNGDFTAVADRFSDVTVATDDGSAGRHARIDHVLTDYLDSASETSLELYSCGPPAMLDAVREIALDRNIPTQLALEAPMGCGFGACFGCAVEKPDGSYMRLCIDGPVVRPDQIATACAEGE